MASLGWVTPGAATEGITPIFSQKTDVFYSSQSLCQFYGVSPHLFSPKKTDDLFLITSTLIDFTRVSPPWTVEGVTLHLFHLSDHVCPLFFVNLPTNFFPLGVTPGGCHPGWSAPPPSDATEQLLVLRCHKQMFLLTEVTR